MAHITGGGLPENLPRCLPSGLAPSVDPSSWPRPELFAWLKQNGDIPERDLWHTFNMGVGFCLVLPEEAVAQALDVCRQLNLPAWCIGEVKPSASDLDADVIGLPR